ncbi:MAG: hypothetical protein K9L86_05330 [Candidatus Omnitrophica bacterium]|nr:hypothetical protein [Candidatus Omnitrophota bacterium]
MEPEVYQLESNQIIDLPSKDIDADEVRAQVVRATRDFKNSWKSLAKVLHIVWEEKLYRNWGYEKFDQFTEKEVHVRKHTAMKLIRSYAFLEKEEPLYLKDSRAEDEPNKVTPSFDVVNALQRARKTLSDDDYRKVKSDLLDKGKHLGEVKKDLTQMIRQRREDIDPEKERTRSGRVAIMRFISDLKRVRREIETLSVLPEDIANDINKLLAKVEAYLV